MPDMHFKVYCQNIENTGTQAKSGNLVVYHGLTDSFKHRIHVFIEFLSENEKSRAERFIHKSDYNCYVSVHALLRIELSKYLGTKAKSIVIREYENGKPYIPETDLPFSLSRTRNMFAFVVGQSMHFLGIDIEQIKPDIDFINISRNYFSVKEQQLILSFKNVADQKRAFFEIWTRKEALLKAIGIGINEEISKFEVLEGENILEIEEVQVHEHFMITSVMKKDALISVASSADFVPVFKNLSFIPS